MSKSKKAKNQRWYSQRPGESLLDFECRAKV